MKRSYFNIKATGAHQLDSLSQTLEMNDSFEMNEDFDGEEKDENKRKSRNLSEKKRRDQFNLLINELCSIINYNHTMTAGHHHNSNSGCGGGSTNGDNSSNSGGGKHKTDKSSILRASIAFLKTHSDSLNTKSDDNSKQKLKTANDGQPTNGQTFSIFSWKPSFMANDEFVHLMLEALDSFLIIIETSIDGKIMYVSDTIYPLLGLSSTTLHPTVTTDDHRNGRHHNQHQHRLSIYDLIHDEEKVFVKQFLQHKQEEGSHSDDKFASILVHFKDHDFDDRLTENYRVVRLIGTFCDVNQLAAQTSKGTNRSANGMANNGTSRWCFVGIGRLQTPKFLRELQFQWPTERLDGRQFVSRNSLEWKFLYLDHRAPPIIGYLPFEILGTSGYDYYHWDDLDAVVADHEVLMRTGEATSQAYRFLTKSHQWIWLRTSYYIAYHQWNSKPEFVVCTHTVVNESEVAANKISKINNKINDKLHNNVVTNDPNDQNINHNCQELSRQPVMLSPPTVPLMPSHMSWSPMGSSYTNTQTPMDYRDISQRQVMSSSDSDKTGEESSSNMSQISHKSSLLHEFLRQKHRLLEHKIRQQQEELRRITHQLDSVSSIGNE